MRKFILYIGLIIFLISCNALKQDNIFGKYEKRGNDYFYSLILNKDSSFVFKEAYDIGSAECEGKWSSIPKDKILLICKEEGLIGQMSVGYMVNREYTVEILNSKKIKIKNVVLKRVRNVSD